MGLFEIQEDTLIPFSRVPIGPDLYEEQIEDLLWANLEEFTGTTLFPVRRQARITGGGKPDIVALDESGHVVVIEVKRDVDRNQLAQCLEYAGWARTANLDELAGLYYEGPAAFFSAWQEFTATETPVLLQRPPQLILVARDLHDRTEAALGFLADSDLPVVVLRATFYEDERGKRFVDIIGRNETEMAPGSPTGVFSSGGAAHVNPRGRRVTLSDLLEASLLEADEPLVWERPRVGQTFRATVTAGGAIRLEDGRVRGSPSRAAMDAADVPAYDGWLAWRAVNRDGKLLADLRKQLATAATDDEGGIDAV